MERGAEHYGDSFIPPRTLGRANAERMAAELLRDYWYEIRKGVDDALTDSALQE